MDALEGSIKRAGNWICANPSIVLILIIAGSFTAQIIFFSGSPYLPGDDGGYYIYYTQSLLDGAWKGSILEPSPAIFALSAFFSLFLGVGSGILVATCLLSSLVCLPVFIISKHLFKDVRVSLLSAFLVAFSAFAFVMSADWRKNVAAAFMVPLLLFLILKFFQNRKYLLPVAVAGVAAALSHKTAFSAGFVLIAYFIFRAVFKRDLPRKEIALFVALSLAFLAGLFIISPNIMGELKWISTASRLEGSALLGFWPYVLPLLITSPLGFAICLRRREKEDLFIIGWTASLSILSLGQAGGYEGYRFVYLLLAPLAILSAIGAFWIYRKSKRLGRGTVAVLLIFTLLQLAYAGMYDRSTRTTPSSDALDAIKEASGLIPRDAAVYSEFFRNGQPNYWINGVFFERDLRPIDFASQDRYINEDLELGKEVYLIKLSWGAISGDFSNEESFVQAEPNLDLFYNKSGVSVFKVTGRMLEYEIIIDATGVREDSVYDYGRFMRATTYLMIPYEAMRALNPPNLPIFQAAIGIPATMLWIGFLMLLLASRVERLGRKGQYALLFLISALVFLSVLVKPVFI